MENFDDNLENEYRRRFDNFEETPDDFLWSNIQARIGTEKKRPLLVWWNTLKRPVSIAAGLLIGLIGIAYFLTKTNNNGSSQFSSNDTIGDRKSELNSKTDKQIAAGVDERETINVPEVAEKEQKEAIQVLAPKQEKLWAAKEQNNSSGSTGKLIHEQLASTINVPDVMAEVKTNDRLHKDLYAIEGKEISLSSVQKHLQAPEIQTQEIAYISPEKNKRLFLAPTEIFANVTSSLSYYMITPNKSDHVMVSDFSNGSQRLGFAAQLGFVYPVARKVDLRTGLSYFTRKSSISYGVSDDSKKNVTVIDDNSIKIDPGSSTMSEIKNWQYIELQSDVLLHIKRMQALAVGMKFGVQTSAFSSPLVQARLGYRISKPMANRWALWLEPAVSFSLSSQNSIENLFMYRTTGLGINLGVSLLK